MIDNILSDTTNDKMIKKKFKEMKKKVHQHIN